MKTSEICKDLAKNALMTKGIKVFKRNLVVEVDKAPDWTIVTDTASGRIFRCTRNKETDTYKVSEDMFYQTGSNIWKEI